MLIIGVTKNYVVLYKPGHNWVKELKIKFKVQLI